VPVLHLLNFTYKTLMRVLGRLTFMYAQFRARLLSRESSMGLPNIVFVLGGPGAGKGTQCMNIVKEFGYVHLSAGDLLRAERKKPGSATGELIEKHITEGSIVPVEITCSLLEEAMQDSIRDGGKGNFLIDGFPRNEDNLMGWNNQMGHKVNLQFVLFFDCDEDVCVKRCLSRGASGSGRSDDNEDSLKKRIKTYNESTRPIIEGYNKNGLVRRVEADRAPDEIFEEVAQLFRAVNPPSQ